MVDARAVQIHESTHDGVTVLRLVGPVVDPGMMVRLAQQLLDGRIDGGHVVLDLDGLSVHDPAALCALFARLSVCADGVPIPSAAADAGIRRLLRACGSSAAGLVCFPSVAEAAAVARTSFAPA